MPHSAGHSFLGVVLLCSGQSGNLRMKKSSRGIVHLLVLFLDLNFFSNNSGSDSSELPSGDTALLKIR